ncbi:MAG TPA: hypothetical protein VIM94_06340 [Salegentibacter sp.]|uniref:hypothetical protein n=1 Tax=Salegentibacter sp. TaxID=1903072 RepID=UPI002F933442
MKYLFPILALFILVRPFSPYAEYILNYDYISEVLCLNKDKPELDCDGKCYLMQSLAEASAEDGNNRKFPPKELDFQLLFFNKDSLTQDISEFEYKSSLKYDAHSHLSYHFFTGSKIFRPPIS